MRTAYLIASAGLLVAACVPKVTEHIPCTTNAQCAEWPGLVCDTGKGICVCDGTATYPGCSNSMDARPAGPEILTPTDGLIIDVDPTTDGDADAAPTPDAAAPDTANPDTASPDTKPIQCTNSTQCSGPAPICTSNVCAACTAGSQCLAKDPNTSVCATTGAAAGQCVQCVDDSSCKAAPGTPVCGPNNRCVECTSKANCQGTARACELTKNLCVECTDNTTCSGAAPICDVAANKCTACTLTSQCLAKDASNPACATSGAAAGQCVQCTDNTACKAMSATPACNTIRNKCVECTSSGDCLPATPLCDTSVNKCMPCTASNECALLADPKRAVCAPSGACVACTKNADCSGGTPLCDVAANKCVACTASAQCAALSDAKRAICSATGACVECTDNTTCGGSTPLCDTTTNKCVGCTASAQCAALSDAKRAVCNLTSGACVECTASTSCAGTTPICNAGTNKCAACSASTECAGLGDANRATCASTGACVQCTSNTHCSGVAGAPYCETGTSKCVECLASSNCTGNKPICTATTCGACKSDKECQDKDTNTPICATSGSAAGQCVRCTSNSHCGGSTPICETTTNTCRPCTGDNECTGMGPGVCMKHQDGRCASDAETVVVTSSATLPSSIPSGKRLIIIRGSVSGTVAWTLPTTQVTIIGQNTGVLTGNGMAPTMHLTGGDFYMRDLSITGGSPGLQADGGAIARLDHVSVSNNTAGGILLDGAAFDIKNTTVNGNGANTAGAVLFGGIGIQNTPATGPRSVSRSTINNNQLVGVSCGTGSGVSPVPTDVLVSGNTGGQISGLCGFTSCAAASSSCGAQ